MSDEKNPIEEAVEQAVDLFVYAPIGLAFEGPALLPTLVERGKNQVAAARMIGKFAVDAGGAEVAKQLGRLAEQVGEQSGLGGIVDLITGRRPAAASASPSPKTPAPARPSGNGAAAPDAVESPSEPAAAAAPKAKTPSGNTAHLAITDYDSLSASQVVNRLGGLSSTELEAVKDYEGAHRGRKTILNKIAQLQSP